MFAVSTAIGLNPQPLQIMDSRVKRYLITLIEDDRDHHQETLKYNENAMFEIENGGKLTQADKNNLTHYRQEVERCNKAIDFSNLSINTVKAS